MSKLKVCVVGFGYWGANHARVLDELGNLSGIYDIAINEKSDIKYNVFKNIEEAIESSDAAIISTPAKTHYSIAQELIPHLNLLVEKPLALSKDECSKLVDLSKKHGKILMVGHQLHFHPAVLKMQEMVDEGQLGVIKWVYSNRLNMGKIRSEENVLWSFAPHDISLMLSVVDSDIKKLDVQGASLVNKEIEDASLTSLEFKNGVKGHIFVSWFHPFKEQRFVIVGEEGTIVFSDTNENDKLLKYKTKIDSDSLAIVDHETIKIKYNESEPLKNQAIHFLEAIESSKCRINNGEHGMKVVEILEMSSNLLKN